MSTPTVKVIDKRSVHQICSGQVVVTLATAVKELVENGLDAGTTNIEVRLKNWGADSLEVVDNGFGVLPENFAALALKHHTSKLNVFADLVGVETFGFRGEALSSLCALGNLSITTCHKSQSIGARIEYDHDGQITKQQATARTHGTTVTLQNLFSTLPVRHKEFLRNIKREYTKMMQVLQGYCVISTGVRISCYTIGEKGKKSVALATHGNNDMRENISNVFGPKQLQTLLEFKQINPTADDCGELGLESQLDSDPVFCLTGFVSRCDHGTGRSANDRQYIYINKRPCDMPKLTRLVNEVYHMFNRNQYPFLVLNIDLSKDLVDVNVTPDKRQVFLQQEKLLFATVKSSLKAMYDPGATNYETNQKPFAQLKLPAFTKRNKEENATPFSKSIKDRLLLAAKVSKNKEASSILKFTTKPSESVEELDNISKVCKNGDAIVSTGSTEITIDSGTLATSKDELSNISKVNKIGEAVSLDSTEIKADSKTLAVSKDGLALDDVSGIGNTHKQGDSSTDSIIETHEEAFSPQIENSPGPSPVGNGHLNPKEYDLSSTEAHAREDTADKLRCEKSENPGKGVNVINCEPTHSPKQNELCLLESVLGDPPRHSVSEDAEQSQGKLCNVETFQNSIDSVTENGNCTNNLIQDNVELTKKLENSKELGESARIENGFEVLDVENLYESETAYESVNMIGKYSSETPELKRRRSPESDGSENHCNTKKIKVDGGYDNELKRTSRKSIAVNFDLQKLRERFTAEHGGNELEAEGSSGYSRTFRATIAPQSNQRAEEELERHITKEMFSKMEIVGQFNQGFITTKLGDDLFIIDQHASDEKYNFEDQQRNTVLKSQRLICPQSLDLTAVNENILMENLEVFRKNGFDFEIDETSPISQRVKLISLPVSRNWSFGKSDIEELIFMLSDSPGVNYRPSNIRKMFASRACRMSVMVGTALNDGQMRRIVGHMGEMDHPWNCPHGRPTMRHLINLNMVRK